jgi:hypothetical protein
MGWRSMNTVVDLFPDTAPPADPLIGRAVCLATVCWRCGTNVALINPGRGPHAAELRCRNCDAHRQWLSHANHTSIASFFAGFENEFGAPAEIIYRLPPPTTETDMANGQYDNTNRGALFKNTDKTDEKHADYRGEINVAGVEHWLNAWIKTSKKGTKFLSLSLKPKQPAAAKPTSTLGDDMNDEIAF